MPIPRYPGCLAISAQSAQSARRCAAPACKLSAGLQALGDALRCADLICDELSRQGACIGPVCSYIPFPSQGACTITSVHYMVCHSINHAHIARFVTHTRLTKLALSSFTIPQPLPANFPVSLLPQSVRCMHASVHLTELPMIKSPCPL